MNGPGDRRTLLGTLSPLLMQADHANPLHVQIVLIDDRRVAVAVESVGHRQTAKLAEQVAGGVVHVDALDFTGILLRLTRTPVASKIALAIAAGTAG